MKMDDIEKHSYHDGFITGLYKGGVIKGEFPEDETERTGLVSFEFWFKKMHEVNLEAGDFVQEDSIFSDEGTLKFPDGDASIISLKVSKADEQYQFKLCAISDSCGFIKVQVRCDDIHSKLKKYNGMSYRNIYCEEMFDSRKYVLDEQYFREEETTMLEDGYMFSANCYCDEEKRSSQIIRRAYLEKDCLIKDGRIIYEYLCSYNHPRIIENFIHHSNGHTYFAHHTDLYGISYFDLETHEIFNYIPEGWEHDYRQSSGESFIITDIYYNRQNNLVAYEGCYWAGPVEVMIGDLSDPLNFDPRLLRLHDLLDPEWEEFDDLSFGGWKEEGLTVIADWKKEYTLDLEQLIKEKGNLNLTVE